MASESTLKRLLTAARSSARAAGERLARAVDRREKWHKRVGERRKKERLAEAKLEHAREGRDQARAVVERLQEDGHGPGEPRFDEARYALTEAQDRVAQYTKDAERARQRASRAVKALNRWRRVAAAALRSRRYWREAAKNRLQRLKRWREAHAGPPPFRVEWLNGHPNTLTDTAEHNLRYIKWRWPALYVTSTSRNWGTDSYHEEVPTKVFDIAGPWNTMINLQEWLYWNHPGAMLELLGPANDKMVKNGQRWAAREGEFLEYLHDSHDHCCFSARVW